MLGMESIGFCWSDVIRFASSFGFDTSRRSIHHSHSCLIISSLQIPRLAARPLFSIMGLSFSKETPYLSGPQVPQGANEPPTFATVQQVVRCHKALEGQVSALREVTKAHQTHLKLVANEFILRDKQAALEKERMARTMNARFAELHNRVDALEKQVNDLLEHFGQVAEAEDDESVLFEEEEVADMEGEEGEPIPVLAALQQKRDTKLAALESANKTIATLVASGNMAAADKIRQITAGLAGDIANLEIQIALAST